jgi:putative membrane protein
VLLSVGTTQGRLAAAATDADGIVSSASDLADGLESTSTVAGEVVGGLEALADGTSAAGKGAKTLATGVRELASGAAQLSSGASSLADGAAGIATGNRKLADALKAMAAGTKGFGAQTQALDAGAQAVAGGVAKYTGSVAALSANCAALGEQRRPLRELAALAAEGPELATSASGVAAGTGQLAASAPSLEGGIAQTAKGAKKLATGSSKLATGAEALATGAESAASGASTLASGTAAAASGVSKLAAGIRDAVDGARLVEAGIAGLATDGRSVADAALSMTEGLKREGRSASVLSEAERQGVSQAIADPVVVESVSNTSAGTTGTDLAPSFMALALWVGALATFLVMPALPERLRRSGRRSQALTWLLVAAGLGIVQVLLMVGALRWAVGIEVARLPELVVLAAFAMVTAMAIVQALVALFGMRGWFVALLLLVVQAAAAGAWYPIETAPRILQALHPFLPMTYTVEAFEVLTAGGGGSILPAMAVLLLWSVGAFAVTLLATHLRSAGSPPQTQPAVSAARG